MVNIISGLRMNVDLKTLELFCTVAEELSITLAAQRLGRAPSNVTTRIQQLEKELKVTLFLRHSKRLHLSQQGEQLLVYAKRILAVAEEAQQVLHPGKPGGLLRIGSMESTAASRLPSPLAKYHRRWPEVTIQLTTGPSRQMLESLQDRTIDCALVAMSPGREGYDSSNFSSMGLVGHPIFKEELMLVLPAGHPPVDSASDIAVSSLAAFRRGCTYRAIAED
ncbi:MAG: LysR family transcriptional regulator, partial [Marinobacter sp.]